MSKQTVSEFIQLAFAIVGDQKWSKNRSNFIRNEKNECPICAVANKITGYKFLNSEVMSASYHIGLSTNIVNSIVDAADDFKRGTTRNLLINTLVKKS